MTVQMIEGVNPPMPGSYVAWVNGSHGVVADRQILFWDGNDWSYPLSDQRYRDHVYGWAGPLQVLELED